MMTVDKLIDHARQHRSDAPVAGDILTKTTLAAVLRDLLELQLFALSENAERLAAAMPAVGRVNGGWSNMRPVEPDPREDSVARSLAALISRVEDLQE